MGAAEVVVRKVKSDCGGAVFDLLQACVGQAGEAAHGHPHREVLTLNVAGVNVH